LSVFRFALQPLLDEHFRAEDECRGALAAAAHNAAAARARAVAAQTDLARAGADFRALDPWVSPAAASTALGRVLLLGDALRYAQANALRCAEHETRAREAYTAARFERRRVELLRDRALAAFTRAVEHAEALQIDEANAARHNSTTMFAPSLHN
jgi:hypothetical protein